MSIKTNDNQLLRAPKPLDDRTGFWLNGMWRNYTSVAQALADPDVINYRYPSMTIPIYDGVNPTVEYWFDGGILDSDFIEKSVDLTGYVDLTTDQLIDGNKSFVKDLTVNGLTIGKGSGSDISTAIGVGALGNNLGDNTAVGYTSGYEITTGNANTSLGFNTLRNIRTASNNTAIGHTVLRDAASGDGNTGVGYRSMYDVVSPGDDITLVGSNTTLSNAPLSNASAFGAGSVVDASNKIQLGNTSVTLINTSATYQGNGFVKTGGTSSQFLKADGSVDSTTYATQSSLTGYQLLTQKNQANGYAGLDTGGKILMSQLPDSILGALIYQGVWNAATNTPTLVNPPASSTKGYFYVTDVAGTQFGLTFAVGDWIVSNGAAWQKVDNTDAVVSVFGRIGNVLANESDYSTFYPLLSGSYANPSWIASLPYSKITGTPNLTGYELLANKQNSLSVDGTGVKYPTVDAVNIGLTSNYDNLSQNLLSKEYVSNFDIADNTSTISTSTFDGFGILVQTLSNKIMMIYREGTGHVSIDGKIAMRSSTDGGKTFSTITYIDQQPGVDLRNIAGGVTPSGRVVIFYSRATNVNTVFTFLDQGTRYSDDDGVTWSNYEIQGDSGADVYSPYGNLISIANGRIAIPWYGILPDGTGNTYLKFSDDNGKTWGDDVLVGGGNPVQYSEAAYAYLDGGVILCVVRQSPVNARLRQLISLDNGQTWTNQGDIPYSKGTNIAPWMNVYTESDGKKYVALFFTSKDITPRTLVSVTASKDEVTAGVSSWKDEKIILSNPASSDYGYMSVINPRQGKKMLGMYYVANSLDTTAIANYSFFNVTPSYITYKGNNIGFGTDNPNYKLHSYATGNNYLQMTNLLTGSSVSDGFLFGIDGVGGVQFYNRENTPIQFFTNNLERVRIHGSGGFSIGSISDPGSSNLSVAGKATVAVAPVNPTDVVRKQDLDAQGIASGTYTPTATLSSNAVNATVKQANYTKVGSVVTVYGTVTVTAGVSQGATAVELTLPIASNLTLSDDLSGMAQTSWLLQGNQGKISTNTTDNRAVLTYNNPNSSVTTDCYYSYMYIIK